MRERPPYLKRNSKVLNGWTALPILCLVMGMGFFALAAYFAWFGHVSRSWPQVPGRIAGSGTAESTMTKTSGPGVTSTSYQGIVEFVYPTDRDPLYGRHFGRRVFFGFQSFVTHKEAAKLASMYPEGSSVTVYSDPDNPRRAVLEPGIVWSSVATGLVPALLFFVAFIYLLRRRPSSAER